MGVGVEIASRRQFVCWRRLEHCGIRPCGEVIVLPRCAPLLDYSATWQRERDI